MSISQSIDAPITTRDTVSMSGSLSSQNGNAQGEFFCIENQYGYRIKLFSIFTGGFLLCGRRLINQGWFEFIAGAGNGPIIGVKASRNLTNKVFCNGDFSLNFRKNGIIPGLVGSRAKDIFVVTILHIFLYFNDIFSSCGPIRQTHSRISYV